MTQQVINFGLIGCGLMGREFASAVGRWFHLRNLAVRPQIVAVCDPDPAARQWFTENVPSVRWAVERHEDLLSEASVHAVYCAVPHNLHSALYTDILSAGKHLIGEKPFGIDLPANRQINRAIEQHPQLLVRCSSEMPFFPGAFQIARLVTAGQFGRIIEVESGLWHSSDLNPEKPINWKRRIATCGEYGVLGDLGMHALHLPLRFGWRPRNVRAVLTKIVTHRPDGCGGVVPCETWDNATLLCSACDADGNEFPLSISTKRIAPGHNNTWFLRIIGTRLSAEYSTRYPKQLLTLPYDRPGATQSWHHTDVAYETAYPTITGSIFEFGFSDAILQMWAAYCDELAHGRQNMRQPLYCATPAEAAETHRIFTAALQSQAQQATIALNQPA
ncbi:MAG: Gfo/Idh/MocA family oxidoreductase [Phycisphaerae bacterium]|nr:Gfo/Idh/MocA family oxidoreductase [Phycisphaerae bacterium]MDW8263617.1 Gfo/Idh/MocA family oxidoreductase [Phycisphaerales bacterium]